ncbi:UvrD/REP helicase, partial [mine drainage metagenome]
MGRMEGVHLMDGGEQRLYYSRTADACGLEIEQVTQIIEAIKTSPVPQANSDAAVVYRIYKNLIDKNRYWDFADLIRATVEGMSDGSIATWNADLMLVDEFQDTDALQYELIRLHRTRSQLTVAGDDDQEIYGFRHAMGTAGMLRFENEFRARRFVFGRNYRSTAEIVDSSSRLIRRNMQRMPKAIYAVRQHRAGPAGQDCAEIVHPTVLDEARDALQTMAGDLQANPGATGAILARTNRHLYLVKAEYEMAGEEGGVPAVVRNTPMVSLSVGGLQNDSIGAILMTLFRTLVWVQEKRGIETLMVHFLGYPSGVVDPLIRRGFGSLIQALSNLKAAEVRGAHHAQMVQMSNAHPIWVQNLQEAQGAEYGKALSSVTRQIVRWMCSVIQESPQGEYTQRDERILWALRHQVLALGGRPLEVRLRQMRESEREVPKGLMPGTLALVTMHGAKGME